MILFCYFEQLYANNWASQVAQWLRIHMQCKRALGQEDPLEKEMATHSSILALRIPWMEEYGGLQSTGSERVGYDLATEQQQRLCWSLLK